MLLDWAFFICFLSTWPTIYCQYKSIFSLQSINEVKRHVHHQFLTCIKYVSIIFEQFWMPCSNGGIALFILINHILNRKCSFIWICVNNFNMSHCHQLNVILFKLLWCWRFFLSVPHHRFTRFEIIFEIIDSINSISSSSRFVINAWHCRHCVQGILNRLGHAIVNDKFPFVKYGSICLWEHRISGSHLPNHMIYHSRTTQKENVHKFVWNIFIISIYGLIYFHQNTKQIFVEFPKTKDAITLKKHQWFFLECIVLIIIDEINVEVLSITCIGFIK